MQLKGCEDLSAETAATAETLANLIRAVALEKTGRPDVLQLKAYACPGPGGNFDEGEAGSSPFALHLPFPSGTYWEVGIIGSYFGNGQHCNGLDDYYATDWNKRNTNCASGYLEDNQTPVQPVANGNVTAATCDTGIGYGCRVEITHSSNIRTRYAHLYEYYVTSSGSPAINHWDTLGLVGCSGLSSCGPHLHLSFLEYKEGSYKSRCNGPAGWTNCPNTLGKLSPQTVKPSPIISNGVQVALDETCYKSSNEQGGGSGGWSQTVDDSQAYLGGPSQYWWQVYGYGQGGQMHYTWNAQSSGTNWIYWYFNVPQSGNYKVEVYTPSNHATTTSARYYVHNGSSWVGPYVVNQNTKYNEWVTLTTIYLTAGTKIVYVGDVTGEATGTRKVGVDAARMTKQ